MAVKHLDGLRIQGRSDDSSGAVDGLGSDADATLNGAVASSDSAIYGKNSLSFDGTDDTVNLGNDLDAVFSTSGEFTFSCWAYMPNATSSGNKTIISKPATTSWSSPHHSFTVQHTGGNIDFQTNDGSDANNTTVACGAGWHFIVITKTSSNVWVLKIDNNTSSTVTLSPTMGTQDWIVGNTPYNSRFFDGKLQDVAFWSRVLTSAEQTILYGTKSGVGNATSSATGVVATGVSQTSLRAYYTLNDTTTGVTNSATATDESKTSITNMAIGTRYEEIDTRKIFRYGTDLVSGANLKVYLKFDEASGNIINVAGDVTGNATLATGGNLTQSGGTYAQSTPSGLGNGLLYDGTDDDGVFNTGSNTTSQFNFMHNTTANFTVCVWLKFPNDVTSNETLIDTYNGNDANVGMRLNTTPQGHFNITVARGSGNTFVIYTDGNPQLEIPDDNAWHFYCFRYDYTEGSDALIYSVDNATSGTYYEEFALGWYGGGTPNTAVNDDAYQAMYLGTKNGSAYFMNAVYAEFSLWNRRLTPAEVTQIYNSGDGFQLDTGLAVWKEKGTA